MYIFEKLVTLLNMYIYVPSSDLSGDTREGGDTKWLFFLEEII